MARDILSRRRLNYFRPFDGTVNTWYQVLMKKPASSDIKNALVWVAVLAVIAVWLVKHSGD